MAAICAAPSAAAAAAMARLSVSAVVEGGCGASLAAAQTHRVRSQGAEAASPTVRCDEPVAYVAETATRASADRKLPPQAGSVARDAGAASAAPIFVVGF